MSLWKLDNNEDNDYKHDRAIATFIGFVDFFVLIFSTHYKNTYMFKTAY